MQLTNNITATVALLAGLSAAAPLERRGFSALLPTSPEDIKQVQIDARGSLPNSPPPPKLEQSSLTAFQLIQFNEQFEVAFFSSMLENVTNGGNGWDAPDKDKLIDALKVVVAQEKLHALDAKGVLDHFKAFSPPPCQYQFPTDSLRDAVSLAETFTSVVLGTLQDANQLLAKNGDAGPVRAVSAVIGQEGEQNGFYRSYLSHPPSSQPFLTTSIAPFAYSALQAFVVKDSCPFKLTDIDIPIFAPLVVKQMVDGGEVRAMNQKLSFSVDLRQLITAGRFLGKDTGALFVTYLSGLNVPLSVPVQNPQWEGSKITFDADFPFEQNSMFGLSIAALTFDNGFASPDDVAKSTLAGPGLIQVN
ncbi:late sexual development protein [Colletotrichum graminicola]|uniref:Late sexual development protein n=1 Tax=Colletotrichum graminicola (strain M1.001 / M2 / FGSC 10212) TaxID=645133 RepID=E3QJ27_COLGM|nr:late sexual development protein [Colletotrichum graminicola M1.001]EFQ30865.1 late sexual development protein [Colletotrichum graminicola M1.001]WDK21645.1 late sexual development protein [Colletotrichum graminicola]